MIEPTYKKFHNLRENGMLVKYLLMNRAGENMKPQQRAESVDWKLNLSYEKRARNTPQKNCLEEIGFTVLGNWGRALMSHTNVPFKIRCMVFREAFITETYLDGLKVIEIDGINKNCYDHWCGKLPCFAHHLRTWGEAGIVKTITGKVSKVLDR